MSRQKEGRLVDTALDVLRARGAVAIKNHASPFHRKGEPDVIGVYQEKGFAIEGKRPGEDPSEAQIIRLREWDRAGACVGVADTLEDYIDIAIRRKSNLAKYDIYPKEK